MKCIYCHQPAGLFSLWHKECRQRHSSAIKEIKKVLALEIARFKNLEQIKTEFAETINSGYVNDKELCGLIIAAIKKILSKNPVDITTLIPLTLSLPEKFKKKVIGEPVFREQCASAFQEEFSTLNQGDERAATLTTLLEALRSEDISFSSELLAVLDKRAVEYLEDDIIDNREEEEIQFYLEHSLLKDTEELYNSNAYQKMVQSAILRDIQEGKTVDRMQVEGLPVLLGKNEQLLWVFKGIDGYEEKTGSQFHSGSRGVGIKICKGVYYRVGASKGYSTEYQYMKELGNGILVVTTKNIIFIAGKQVKIGIPKILSMEPYSDGIKIVKDGANPKPYTFLGLDPWFVVNAINRLY